MDTVNHDFHKLSKAEWIELIRESLRGKSLNDFEWKAAPDLSGEPLTHIDDAVNPSPAFTGNRSTNEWKIGVDYSGQINIAEFEGIDAMIIDEPLASCLSESIADATKRILRFQDEKGIRLSYLNKLPAETFHILLNDLWNSNPHFLAEVLDAADKTSNICFEIDKDIAKDPVVPALAASFGDMLVWLNKIGDNKQQHSLFKKMRLIYNLKTADILFEISMIRALKVLWYNLGQAIFEEATELPLDVVIHPANLTEEKNHQLILGTVATMAAAISGVETIFIRPAESDPVNSMESQRLFRNIQLILKHESNIAMVLDPVAGSYAIEDLTEKISSATWNHLVSLSDRNLSR